MEKFDLVLENYFFKAKSAVLEEGVSAEETKRAEVVLAEAASTLQNVKEFVKRHKGKLGALAGAALAGGLTYGAHKGMLGDDAKEMVDTAGEKIADTYHSAMQKVGLEKHQPSVWESILNAFRSEKS